MTQTDRNDYRAMADGNRERMAQSIEVAQKCFENGQLDIAGHMAEATVGEAARAQVYGAIVQAAEQVASGSGVHATIETVTQTAWGAVRSVIRSGQYDGSTRDLDNMVDAYIDSKKAGVLHGSVARVALRGVRDYLGRRRTVRPFDFAVAETWFEHWLDDVAEGPEYVAAAKQD